MHSYETTLGRLCLVPAPLDFMCESQVPLSHVMPMHTLEVASQLSHWVCENAKSTRALLKRIDAVCPLKTPIQLQTLVELPRLVHKKGDHAAGVDTSSLLGPALAGHDLGLVSAVLSRNACALSAANKCNKLRMSRQDGWCGESPFNSKFST